MYHQKSRGVERSGGSRRQAGPGFNVLPSQTDYSLLGNSRGDTLTRVKKGVNATVFPNFRAFGSSKPAVRAFEYSQIKSNLGCANSAGRNPELQHPPEAVDRGPAAPLSWSVGLPRPTRSTSSLPHHRWVDRSALLQMLQ